MMECAESTEGSSEASHKKVRIAHLVSHPVQYLVPVYREISKSANIDFTVYFFSDTSIGKHFDGDFGREFEWSTPLLGGYKSRFFPSSRGKRTGKSFEWPNWDLLAEVIRQQYDVIWINSYTGTNAWVASNCGSRFGDAGLLSRRHEFADSASLLEANIEAYFSSKFLARYVGAIRR